jgi:hypothetical protein
VAASRIALARANLLALKAKPAAKAKAKPVK